MQEKPLVTVICTCYNHEYYVLEALNSVINQEYTNTELVIVDDFSSDNSSIVIQSWVKNYPKTKYIQNEKNIGITKSFNKAVRFANGDYLIDLAADDILNPECIKIQLETFNNSNYSNLGLVYGNATVINEKGDFIRTYFPRDQNEKLISKIPTGDVYEYIISDIHSLCSVSAMIKTEIFNALNGYNTDLYYEDLDFWIRASREYHFDFTDVDLVQKRVLKNSLGDNLKKKNTHYKKVNQATFKVLKSTFLLNKNTNEHHKLLKRVFEMTKRSLKTFDIDLFSKYILFIMKIYYSIFIKKTYTS